VQLGFGIITKTGGKMKNPLESKVSYLECVKIQSEVLVPILNHLRDELGNERANELVYSALRNWSGKVFAEVGATKSGSAKDKWQQMTIELDELIGDDVDVEEIQENVEVRDFNVTGCRYAEFFRSIDEPELGSILSCDVDGHIAAVGSPHVSLSIKKTIMKGSTFCDFRYKFSQAHGYDT
jgi:hypothetical protein